MREQPFESEVLLDSMRPNAFSQTAYRWLSNIAEVTKKLLKNPLSASGLIILLGFILIALLAPWLAPIPERHPNAYMIPQDGFSSTPKPPSETHFLGTTQDQYDIWYGLVWGTRTAFKIGFVVIFFTLIVGIVIGALSGYFGGWIDEALMRITEIFIAFPSLVATMVLVTILGKGLDKVIIAFVVFGWMTYARLIRGNVLQVKENAYVEAARAAGANSSRIIFRHVVPNAIFPVLVVASLDIGTVVLGAAALSFLGLGAPEGYADWGQMINYARNWILGTHSDRLAYWYTIFFPGLTISLFVLGWNFIGDAFRDIFDPRLRGSR
jgi:peptide/nickel transport system permease protein